MIQVRMVSRMLVLFALPLAVAGCAARPDAPERGGGGVCATGAGSPNPQTPIVCVDDAARTLSVDPDPITIDDIQGGRPITLVWQTRSGSGELRIGMKDDRCVRNVSCPGNGRCTAQAIPGASATCKYDVWIEGGDYERLDPTVVVTPCCGG